MSISCTWASRKGIGVAGSTGLFLSSCAGPTAFVCCTTGSRGFAVSGAVRTVVAPLSSTSMFYVLIVEKYACRGYLFAICRLSSRDVALLAKDCSRRLFASPVLRQLQIWPTWFVLVTISPFAFGSKERGLLNMRAFEALLD